MIYVLTVLTVLLILISYEFYRFYTKTTALQNFKPTQVWIGEPRGWTVLDENMAILNKEPLKLIKKKFELDLASLAQ
jgi:hypothetical protein